MLFLHMDLVFGVWMPLGQWWNLNVSHVMTYILKNLPNQMLLKLEKCVKWNLNIWEIVHVLCILH